MGEGGLEFNVMKSTKSKRSYSSEGGRASYAPSDEMREAGKAWEYANRYPTYMERYYGEAASTMGGFLVALVRGKAVVLPNKWAVRQMQGVCEPRLKLRVPVLTWMLTYDGAHCFIRGYQAGLRVGK